MAEEASPSRDPGVYNLLMGRDASAGGPTQPVPDEPGDRLARLLARPLDRRTFLALSTLAVPAVLSACGVAPSPTSSQAGPASPGTPLTPSGAVPPTLPPQDAADWVFVGGAVLTMEGGGRAEGIAIRGDRIAAVGTAADVLGRVGPGTRLVDLKGRAILPGFVDAHDHIAVPAGNLRADLDAVENEALSLGITSRGEAAVRPADIGPILRWAATREPRIRTNLYLIHNDNCGQEQGGWYRDHPPTTDRHAKMRIAGVKIYGDGGSCGAPAVTFDYPGGIGKGDLYVEQGSLTSLLENLAEAGYQAVIHCLGDRSLDVIQRSIWDAIGSANPTRHRIDHNAVVRPDQLERYGELDLPLLVFGAFPACLYGGDTSQFKYLVPAEHKALEWPWRDLLDAARPGHVGWHGDAPIFTLDPIEHLASFVRRTQRIDQAVCQPPDWALAHRLDVGQALSLMTIGAAYALDREADVGSLAVGKLADLIVLDADPMAVPPERLRNLTVQLTLVGGAAEFIRPGSEELAPPPATEVPGEITPTPSAPVGLVNVAKGRVATASRSEPGAPPSRAVDGITDGDQLWNAGADAPQWLEVDLGRAFPIAAVRLVVAQFPRGQTRHRVIGRATRAGAGTLLREFSGPTADMDVLGATFDPPIKAIRIIRVETLESPSFVAWREIEVLSPVGSARGPREAAG